MKMRKLFAGIAAAATLLGGMALGAASAQADGPQTTTPLLQVTNAQAGHKYTPYKFATFANADSGSVEVNTVEAWKTFVTTAADAADNDTENSVPAEYKDNPAAYVATFNAEQIRKFAEELAKTNPLPTADGAGLTVTAEQAGTAQPVAVDGEGWYLVTDTYNGKAGTPAVVATTVNVLDNLRIVADAKTGQGGITTVGRFNAKNENPLTPPSKTAKVGDVDVNGKTVNVGDTVDFTVSAAVPASAANYDVYPFTITDTASKGLKVAETNTFKVQVDGKDVDAALYKVEQRRRRHHYDHHVRQREVPGGQDHRRVVHRRRHQGCADRPGRQRGQQGHDHHQWWHQRRRQDRIQDLRLPVQEDRRRQRCQRFGRRAVRRQ